MQFQQLLSIYCWCGFWTWEKNTDIVLQSWLYIFILWGISCARKSKQAFLPIKPLCQQTWDSEIQNWILNRVSPSCILCTLYLSR